jgi:hypothetical protein
MAVNDELVKNVKGSCRYLFKVISQNFPGKPEENEEEPR